MSVANKLSGDDSKMKVELNFKGIDDFEPDNVVQQIEPLKKLVELRQNLSDLLAKTDGNDKLGDLLQDILQNADSQKKLGAELGLDASGENKEEK
jgi:type VI secretion system protein ImpB